VFCYTFHSQLCSHINDKDNKLHYFCSVFKCITLTCVTLTCVTLICVTLTCVTLTCVTLTCVTLTCVTLACVTLTCVTLTCVTLTFVTLTCVTLSHFGPIFIYKTGTSVGQTIYCTIQIYCTGCIPVLLISTTHIHGLKLLIRKFLW